MPEDMPPLPDWVKVGVSFKMVFKDGNKHNGRVFHIRGIVDGCAVTREWWKHKKYWHYTVLEPEFFEAFGQRLQPVKRRKT